MGLFGRLLSLSSPRLRRDATSFARHRFPYRARRQFALPHSPSDATVFRRDSFDRVRSAQHPDRTSAAPSAADLLRPSAEEASPHATISGILCRPAVLPRELRLPRSPPRFLPCGSPRDLTAAPGSALHHLV